MSEIRELLVDALGDDRHGWSIGTFGAIGEFMRTPDEPVTTSDDGGELQIFTGRGGLRIAPRDDIRILAYDTLASDGQTWGQSVAFCLPAESSGGAVIRSLGPDQNALRDEDRGGELFDIGAAKGLVRMCVRTRDEALIAALEEREGHGLFEPGSGHAVGLILKTSPHRVVLSPIGRVEVYSDIPAAEGQSPNGPHTHVLPKLIASGRTHAANAPIPDGLQPVLMFHPRSPWRDGAGKRTEFDASLNAYFESLVDKYGLPEDRMVRRAVEEAVWLGRDPEAFGWPETRRGRAQARIVLRRLAQRHGKQALAPWRALHDHAADEDDDPAELAHA